jgi:hypothetical protein
MKIEQRILAFSELGKFLSSMENSGFQSLAEHARLENPWFTEQNVRKAIEGIIEFLDKKSLEQWLSRYSLPTESKKIGLVMAGNIPLVGFHDLLTVLLAGHIALIKLSSKDQVLMRFIIDKLIALQPEFRHRIVLVDQLKGFDAVIATGSDNSSRYFEYYFGKYPSVIRKNRTSVAILDGNENDDQLKALGNDVFSYFGLGCRNISKIYVPQGYSFTRLLDSWEPFNTIIHHHKYCNNYDYQKSILLVNRVPFFDNGFVLLQENERMVSPISVLFYEFYRDKNDLAEKLRLAENKIQCIEGKNNPATVDFGEAQSPEVTDYADRVDTLQFLCGLN